MKALIPAAGDGTRAVGYTGGISKELVSCRDRPAINYVIAELVGAGITDIVVVTSQSKPDLNLWLTGEDDRILRWRRNGKHEPARLCEEISDHVKITLVYQEEPLGLGHAVLQGRKEIGDSAFVVALPDDIIIPVIQNPTRPSPSSVLASLGREGFSALLTMEVPDEATHKYGIVEYSEGRRYSLPLASRMVEKPDPSETPSRAAAIGRYVFQPEIFGYLERVEAGHGGEIQLTDALELLIREHGSLGITTVDPHHTRFDLGSATTYGDFLDHLSVAHRDGIIYPTVTKAAESIGRQNPQIEGARGH